MDKISDDEVGLILKGVTDKEDRKACWQVSSQWRRVEGSTYRLESSGSPIFAFISSKVSRFVPSGSRKMICGFSFRINSRDLPLTSSHQSQSQETECFRGLWKVWYSHQRGYMLIAAGRRDLRRVYLRRRKGVGNVGATALIKFSNLTHLDLSWCHGITDQALKAIGVTGCLQVLILHGCMLVTDWGIALLDAVTFFSVFIDPLSLSFQFLEHGIYCCKFIYKQFIMLSRNTLSS